MVTIAAPWVVPVEMPVIRDGSVVVVDGRIVDIGRRDDMQRKYPHSSVKVYSDVLMPALVNAHMHLELSHLQISIEAQEVQNFTDWIDALIEQRATQNIGRKEIAEAFTSALEAEYASGVGLIGDIGNEFYDELHREQNDFKPKMVRMLEFLGPNRAACRNALDRLMELDDDILATAHAPYSTAPELLVAIKKRCNRLGHVFSIHTSECLDERELVQTGTGQFRDFLAKKNSWDGLFSFAESGFPGTIEYFDYLGLLDDKTLLVHCVDVTEKELQLVNKRGSRICLCPGSNEFLRVGPAPVAKMVALGLLPALGTDSPVSNRAIDMWKEMQLLVNNYSELTASDVLAMATLGGAKALGYENDYGSLAVGKKAHIIHVSSTILKSCCDREQLMSNLVSGGKPTEIEWVSTSHE